MKSNHCNACGRSDVSQCSHNECPLSSAPDVNKEATVCGLTEREIKGRMAGFACAAPIVVALFDAAWWSFIVAAVFVWIAWLGRESLAEVRELQREMRRGPE